MEKLSGKTVLIVVSSIFAASSIPVILKSESPLSLAAIMAAVIGIVSLLAWGLLKGLDWILRR